jgi:tetratricopeptide (TPR) repeat protein
MKDRFYAADDLAQVEDQKENLAGAEASYRKAIEVSQSYALFNPADSEGWRYWLESVNNLGLTLMEEGRVTEALQVFRGGTQMENDARNVTGVPPTLYYTWRYLSMIEGQLGLVPASLAAVQQARHVDGLLRTRIDAGDDFWQIVAVMNDMNEYESLASQGNFERIHSSALAQVGRIKAIKPMSRLTTGTLLTAERVDRNWLLESELRLGLDRDAEALARDSISRPLFGKMTRVNSADLLSRSKLLLGRALVAQDRKSEALVPLGEAEAHYRERLANGASDTYFRQDFAGTLYQLARAQLDDEEGRAKRRALLAEAAGILDGMTPEARQLRVSKDLIEWVTSARAFAGG